MPDPRLHPRTDPRLADRLTDRLSGRLPHRFDPRDTVDDDTDVVVVPEVPDAEVVPTRVYAYLVDPVTGGTGAFVDYGSLVTSVLVALHTKTSHPWWPPLDQARSDLEQLETVARVSTPAVAPAEAIADADEPQVASIARGGVRGPAMRCLLVGTQVEVIEGDGLTEDGTSTGTLTGVSLRGHSGQRVDDMPVPQGVAIPDQQVQAAIASWVAQARAEDPDFPPYPPPAPPSPPNDEDDNHPGKKPWYCSVWAGAPGCR